MSTETIFMTNEEFKSLLGDLKLRQEDAARLLNVGLKAVQGWCQHTKVPGVIAAHGRDILTSGVEDLPKPPPSAWRVGIIDYHDDKHVPKYTARQYDGAGAWVAAFDDTTAATLLTFIDNEGKTVYRITYIPAVG